MNVPIESIRKFFLLTFLTLSLLNRLLLHWFITMVEMCLLLWEVQLVAGFFVWIILNKQKREEKEGPQLSTRLCRKKVSQKG